MVCCRYSCCLVRFIQCIKAVVKNGTRLIGEGPVKEIEFTVRIKLVGNIHRRQCIFFLCSVCTVSILINPHFHQGRWIVVRIRIVHTKGKGGAAERTIRIDPVSAVTCLTCPGKCRRTVWANHFIGAHIITAALRSGIAVKIIGRCIGCTGLIDEWWNRLEMIIVCCRIDKKRIFGRIDVTAVRGIRHATRKVVPGNSDIGMADNHIIVSGTTFLVGNVSGTWGRIAPKNGVPHRMISGMTDKKHAATVCCIIIGECGVVHGDCCGSAEWVGDCVYHTTFRALVPGKNTVLNAYVSTIGGDHSTSACGGVIWESGFGEDCTVQCSIKVHRSSGSCLVAVDAWVFDGNTSPIGIYGTTFIGCCVISDDGVGKGHGGTTACHTSTVTSRCVGMDLAISEISIIVEVD